MTSSGVSAASPDQVERKVPIVYHPGYNITFYGLERYLHSFDSQKYGKVFHRLKTIFPDMIHYQPDGEITEEDLLLVHTKAYLDSLSYSSTVARITEVFLLAFFPNFILQRVILSPMRLGTAGTIKASELALQHGWAINLSGGYHHAKPDGGEGFCVYADIPLAIRKLLQPGENNNPLVSRILVVDLDAHQGNGLSSIFSSIVTSEGSTSKSVVKYDLPNPSSSNVVHILDIFNGYIYPGDKFAQRFISYPAPLPSYTSDSPYLMTLRQLLPQAVAEVRPDIVFYNAGTDIFARDPLGALSVSEEGILARDEYVFRTCREQNIPIVMVLSGGYTERSAEIIASSIINLNTKRIININS